MNLRVEYVMFIQNIMRHKNKWMNHNDASFYAFEYDDEFKNSNSSEVVLLYMYFM